MKAPWDACTCCLTDREELCSDATCLDVQQAYKDGYEKGLAERAKVIAIYPPTTEKKTN